jgi:hypothetical protein
MKRGEKIPSFYFPSDSYVWRHIEPIPKFGICGQVPLKSGTLIRRISKATIVDAEGYRNILQVWWSSVITLEALDEEYQGTNPVVIKMKITNGKPFIFFCPPVIFLCM